MLEPLRALNLRGQNGLLADIQVEEELRVGKNGRHAIEPPEGAIGPLHELEVLARELNLRIWRKKIRDKGFDSIPYGRGRHARS